MVIIHHRGHRVESTEAAWQGVLDALIAEHGQWETGVSWVEYLQVDASSAVPIGSRGFPNAAAMSTFASTVHDKAAETRINAQHAALNAAGVTVNADEQFFATGTRMAQVGYDTQAQRALEHSEKLPLRDVAAQLSDMVTKEQRKQVTMTGAEIATKLSLNGKLTLAGYKLSERAIRSMLGRAESGAAGYVFALRDRLRDKRADSQADREHLLATLVREMEVARDTQFTLRMREGLGDVFAVVSPSYSVADAPMVLPDVLSALPDGCKGTMAYDPYSTTWELRASVFTPTPVSEQAVGEPFEGYVAFRSNDSGNGRLSGGGGIVLIRCLNASTYESASERSSRTHRGRILFDLPHMARQATRAIDALIDAWGRARETLVPIQLSSMGNPVDANGQLLNVDEVIPGLFRGLLTDRSSQLVAVLPGRRETHVTALAKTYETERRETTKVVRADLANAFTRHGQTQPFAVRRDVETASAAWVTGHHVPRWEPLRA